MTTIFAALSLFSSQPTSEQRRLFCPKEKDNVYREYGYNMGFCWHMYNFYFWILYAKVKERLFCCANEQWPINCKSSIKSIQIWQLFPYKYAHISLANCFCSHVEEKCPENALKTKQKYATYQYEIKMNSQLDPREIANEIPISMQTASRF